MKKLILVLLFALVQISYSQWEQAGNWLYDGIIWSLAISGNNIFAATDGGGVFLSTDNGKSWTAKNSGLTDQDIQSLASSGNYIFVGTYTGGIFRAKLSDLITDVEERMKISSAGISIFPNPSVNTIKIKYSNDMSGQTKITLTDLNGNIKLEQVQSSDITGEQTATIDTSTLKAGTYFVKVEAGKVSTVNKVVIVK